MSSMARPHPRGRIAYTMPRVVVLGVVALLGAIVGGLVTGVILLAADGNVRALSGSLGALKGNLNLRAKDNFNVTAGHVRLVGRDGDFELEHASDLPGSRLVAYKLGTGTRTPIMVGLDDGQNVTPLVVTGSSAQKTDLQQWVAGGGNPALAIDSQGRLRFGNVTIWAASRNGK